MVHVKYPSMERQDLTQGQLGSFKFTPVDEAVRHSPQPHPHPLLVQQYNQSLQRAGWHNQDNASPDPAVDPAFFNHQIKPSLDASRLRYGPATVRAAVESASTSPQKRFVPMHNTMRPSAQSFQPHFAHPSENDSMPSIYTSETNSMPMSDNSLHAVFSNANASLLKALEAEQDAHEGTKLQLEQEAHVRQEAEMETKRLMDHNKTLLNSIKLLQSTVKHMVMSQKDPEADTARALDNAVEEYKRQVENNNTEGSILYDVLANYKHSQTVTRDGKEITCDFNLDLLNTPDPNDLSDKAQLQRTLRRQMGLSSELSLKRDPNVEYQEKIKAIVEETSQQLSPVDKQKLQPQAKPLQEMSANGTTSTKAVPKTTQDDSNIMLELPSSFMSKYGKKPSESERLPRLESTPEPEEPRPVETPRKGDFGTISKSKPIKVQSIGRPEKSAGFIRMPTSVFVDWKLDVRDVKELRNNANRYYYNNADSPFSSHPLRYVPSMADTNIFRTVMIDYLPIGTRYCDVLDQIRGGTLESIQMYPPIATNFITARVVFSHERGAVGLFQRGQQPGIFINNQRVRVWQVQEPTYPKNKELEEAIHQHGHTRLLIVNAPVESIHDVLKMKFRPQIEAGMILDIGSSFDGVPMIEFTSIEESTKGLYRLMEDPEFAGCDFDFDDDYCAARYDAQEFEPGSEVDGKQA